ncbi:MAG: MotA/TolQ/ExbB proton channel family protein [Bacteroides sp.]
MKFITDIMFWVSNGLLIPVIVGLVVLFLLSLLLLGGFLGIRQRQRAHAKKYSPLFSTIKYSGLEPLRETLAAADRSTPFEKVALDLLQVTAAERNYLISTYELELEKRLARPKILTKFGPILGLMGTLIPMGPALVALGTGDVSSMAYNMQVAFATTVLGMFASGIGYFLLQALRAYNQQDLIWLDYINETLSDESK